MPTIERVPMTPAGQQKLKEELDHMKAVERPLILLELEAARAHGDLSENAEYHAAKERLGHVSGRIHDLENRLSKAEIINPATMKGQSKVMFGAHVTVLDVDEDIELTYQIVGDHESDISVNRISVNSPIARGLIGKTREAVVMIKTPKGVRELEIVNIEYREG